MIATPADRDGPPTDNPPHLAGISTWLVDGYNVLNAALLGGQPRTGLRWWSAEGREKLILRVRGFPELSAPAAIPLQNSPGQNPEDAEAEAGSRVWLVFDGGHPAREQFGDESRLRVIFSPSADDWITQRVRSSERPESIAVVSADHQLTGRCRHRGASIVHPRDFIALCDPEPGTSGPPAVADGAAQAEKDDAPNDPE